MDGAQHLADRLASLGWPADATARFAAAARGHNVVAEFPPSPAWCGPLLAAVLQHTLSSGTRTLVLVAPAMLAEWTATIGSLVDGTPITVSTTTDGGAQVLVATPAAALALHQRSQLHPDDISAVVFAWAETWDDDDAIAAVLQDIPREAQRVVITARVDHPATLALVERYARKASTVPMAAGEPSGTMRPPAVTVVPSPWQGRAARAAAFAHHVPQRPLVIWTADLRDHATIRHAFGSLPDGVALTTATVQSGARSVLCYDLPTPAAIRGFGEASVTLLVTPGTADYVARIAPRRTVLDLSGFGDGLRDRDRARCAEIAAALEHQDLAGALYALAPLFEEHDPQQVAAALYQLWTRTGVPAPPPVAAAPAQAHRSAASALVKLWVGAGKKDDATVADLVAILVREVGMDRAEIGRIELRDTFALVEVPADDAEAIATRLTGVTLRRRKLLARVDSRRAAQRGGP